MKRLISSILSLALLFNLLPLNINFAIAQTNTIVSNIQDKHPRLMIDDFSELKKKINSDLAMKNWYEVLKKRTDAEAQMDVISYDLELIKTNDPSGCIPTARETLPRFLSLAFVAGIEDNKAYADRLWLDIEAAGNLPHWNTNHWLTTAEMMQCFAIAYDWCYKFWDETQKTFIMDALMNKGINQTLREYEGNPRYYNWSHKAFDDKHTEATNWANVCNSGVILASLISLERDAELSEKTLTYALRNITGANMRFKGGFPEGSAYWQYALINSMLANSALETSLGGFENVSKLPQLPEPNKYDFLESPGMKNAGDYVIYLQGPDFSANYGDCTDGYTISSALLYLAKRTNNPQYVNHFLNGFNPETYRLDYFVEAMLWYEPSIKRTENTGSLDKNFDIGISSMRSSWANNDDTIFVSMKAGRNRDAHQNFDIGTYNIDALGQRWVKLAGAGSYKWKNYMTPNGRILYYNGRPEGNNTLVINPDETAGQVMISQNELVKSASSKDEGFFVYDLTDTYKDYAKNIKRGIKLYDNRSKVLVQDEVEFKDGKNELWWFNHTDAQITISEDGKGVILTQNGERCYVRMLSPSNGKFTEVEAAPLPTSPNPAVQRASYGTKLAIHLTDASDKTTIAVEYIPLPGNTAPPTTTTTLIPLSSWNVSEEETPNLSSKSSWLVAMQQGSALAYVNGEKKYINSNNHNIKPINNNTIAMVPLKFVVESFGGSVTCNDSTQEAIVKCDYKTIKFKVNSNKINIDGTDIAIDISPITENGTLYVSLNSINTAIGKYVNYDNGFILISDKEEQFKEYPSLLEELKSELKYDVNINGVSALYFSPLKEDYYVRSNNENTVILTSYDGTKYEYSGNDKISFSLDGTVYNFNFVKDTISKSSPYINGLRLICKEVEEYKKQTNGTEDNFEFTYGKTYEFETMVSYSDKTQKIIKNEDVKYYVSDIEIASIDNNGILKITEPGSFYVYASYTVGNITRSNRYIINIESNVVFYDKFEKYKSSAKFNEDFTNTEVLSPIGPFNEDKWKLGNLLKAEIVTLPDGSGQTTQALKVSSNPSSTNWTPTIGGARLYYIKDSDIPTSGILVTEYKLYYEPATLSSEYFNEVKIFGSGTIVGNKTGIGKDTSEYTDAGILKTGWNNVKIIHDISHNTASIYLNDTLSQYHSSTLPSPTNMIQFAKRGPSKNSYIIIDDVKIWHTPKDFEIISSTPQNGEYDVSDISEIKLEFSQPLLDTKIASGDTLFKDMFKLYYDNKNNTVSINEVESSFDGKTLTLKLSEKLEEDNEYILTYNGLTDIYDRSIANDSICFYTKQNLVMDFTVPEFKKENVFTLGGKGTVIQKLESGYISCKYSIENNSPMKKQEVIMFLVLKEDGIFKDIQFIRAMLLPGEKSEFYGGYNIKDPNREYIEFYVFEALKSLTPLSKKYSFTINGLN